jgi:hypothetical protein
MTRSKDMLRRGVAVALTASAALASVGCGDQRPPARMGDASLHLQVAVTPLGEVDSTSSAIHSLAGGSAGYWATVSGSFQLLRFDRDGNGSGQFLGRGQGPDQAGRIHSVEAEPDGAAIVWDGENGRVIRVDQAGAISILRSGPEWRMVLAGPSRQLLGGVTMQIAAMDSALVAGVIDGEFYSTSDYGRLVLIRDDGTKRDTIWSFSNTQRWLDSLVPGRPLHRPFPLWARCDRNTLAVYDAPSQSVHLIDTRGRIGATHKVPKAPAQIDERLVRLFSFHQMRTLAPSTVPDEELRAMALDAPASAITAFSTLVPAYSRMLCTESGAVLLQRFEASEARASGTEFWDVVGPIEGATLLELPTNFRPRLATDTELIGVELDSLDVPRLATGRWRRP